jgi:hypothetical protein
MTAAGALLVLLAIVLLRSGLQFMKEGVGVLGYVAALFTSGFTKGTPPKDPAGWIVSPQQAGLAVLFVAMLFTLFHPGARIFLHVVAAMAAIAVIWYVRMMLTEAKLEILCVPLLVIWFLYYAVCIFWSGNQPSTVAVGS